MNDSFTFSIDWGRALFDSAIWIAMAWAIAAVCTLVVLVLIARYTTWGRQFWRITGAYFTGPHSVKVWLWLAALLLSLWWVACLPDALALFALDQWWYATNGALAIVALIAPILLLRERER